jgi:hypothetical protein
VTAQTGKPPTLSSPDTDRKALDAAIDNAVSFQAPALDQQRPYLIREFAEQMRKLASDPAAFRAVQSKVYCSTFDQKDYIELGMKQAALGRNILIEPGTFQATPRGVSWPLHLWYHHTDKLALPSNDVPDFTDACVLLASFDLDEPSFQQWKEAFDQKKLKLRVWFRFTSVERRSWRNNPLFPNDRVQAHDIAFKVQVLRIDSALQPSEEGPRKPPDPVVEIKKSSRQKLLDELEEKERPKQAALDAELRQIKAAIAQLDKEHAALKLHPRYGDPFFPGMTDKIGEIMRRYYELGERLRAFRQKLGQSQVAYEQEKRKIIIQYPEPGDPSFIEHKGLLLSKEEKAEYDAFDRIHSSPRNAADQAIKTLQDNFIIPAAAYVNSVTNPQDEKMVAVVYRLTGILAGRYVTNFQSYLLVYKRDDGYWYVSDTSGQGGDLWPNTVRFPRK